jgi:hypothetical protein
MKYNNININILPLNSFISLLTVLFIGLKLTHYISWSWWWVLSPIWIPAVLVIGILLVIWIFNILNSVNM